VDVKDHPSEDVGKLLLKQHVLISMVVIGVDAVKYHVGIKLHPQPALPRQEEREIPVCGILNTRTVMNLVAGIILTKHLVKKTNVLGIMVIAPINIVLILVVPIKQHVKVIHST